MERRSAALKAHADKWGIKQHVKHADLAKRAAKQARSGVEASKPGDKSLKIITREGHSEVPVHAWYGQWAAHKGLGEGYSVSHGPTGLAIQGGLTKERAADLAFHMHREMGDAFSGVKFGKNPARTHPDMARGAAAMKKWASLPPEASSEARAFSEKFAAARDKKSIKLSLSKALFDYTW
jgi:hypothetical protein